MSDISMTIRRTVDGPLLAFLTDGDGQATHEDCLVLSVAIVNSEDEADQWKRRMLAERPWEQISN